MPGTEAEVRRGATTVVTAAPIAMFNNDLRDSSGRAAPPALLRVQPPSPARMT